MNYLHPATPLEEETDGSENGGHAIEAIEIPVTTEKGSCYQGEVLRVTGKAFRSGMSFAS